MDRRVFEGLVLGIKPSLSNGYLAIMMKERARIVRRHLRALFVGGNARCGCFMTQGRSVGIFYLSLGSLLGERERERERDRMRDAG